MKHALFFLVLSVFFSCRNERILLLPEIENATITEIHDVSHAYLFYDNSKADNVDLNRKNLISTTNWLINVDKRLRLEQALPNIEFLQHKKRNAEMHKNENAKNYYTGNDTSIQNLGFIEFTNVTYQTMPIRDFFEHRERDERLGIILNAQAENSYSISYKTFKETTSEVFDDIISVRSALQQAIQDQNDHKLYLLFYSELTFQDYMNVKSMIAKLKDHGLMVDSNEFIY